MRGSLLRVVLSVAAVWILACSSGAPAGVTERCVPGEEARCSCSNGTEGVQTCGADRSFDTCVCDGGKGGSGGTGGDGGAGGTGGTGGTGGIEPVNGFACSPGQLDFGNVLKGMSATLSVACTNVTNAAAELVVEPIQGYERAQFTHRYTANGGLVSVAPGETLDIEVVFLANRVGSATAEFQLRTGAGARVWRVRLMGTGLDHAISCAPNSLDFGYVAPGTSVQRSIVCTNAASKAFAITGVALDPSSPRRFTWSPTAYPLSIPGQGSATINVSFSPVAEDAGGRKSGVLVITTDDPSVVRFDVPLTGFVGGPALTCTPSQLDFGVVAQGLPSTRSVVCANSGSGTELLVSDVATSAAEYAATVRGGFRPAGYAVGETFTVDVTYDAVDDDPDTASLTFASNAQNPSYAVALSGEGRVLPPCDLSIFPDSLRFGIVDRDDSATLEIRLQNHRNDAVCVVQDLALAATCNPAFSLPSGALPSATIPPGGELHVPVTFAPTVYGVNQTCELHFDVSNPNEPHRVVPIRGASQSPCLRFEPDPLDFGTVAPGCRSLEQQVRVVNTCATPLNINEIEEYPDDADFHVLAYSPPGTLLAPNESISIPVAYAPQDEGPDTGAIFFRVVGTDEPYMVTAHGVASLSPIQVDSFEQLDRPKVDVLWVIDNSATMADEQMALAVNVAPFLSYAQAQLIDYQIGVTTTGLTPPATPSCPGGAGGGEDGRLFPVDNSRPRVLTPSMASNEAIWAANVQVGTCHSDEQDAEAALRALNPPVIDLCDDPRHPEPNDGNCGFLRPEAHLSVIFLTDEVDGSPSSMAFYASAFRSVKGYRNDHLVSVHAVTGDRGTGCGNGSAAAGDLLISLAQQTEGGTFHSICSTNWAQTLRELSAAVFGFETCYPLRNLPADNNGDGTIADGQGELEVRVNGMVRASTNAVGQQVWRYRADRNAVCFAPTAVPHPGTQIDVRYEPSCLNF